MDLFILFLSMILPILALVIIFHSTNPKTHNNTPPGSFGWPILGESYEFLHGEPSKFMRGRMKKYSTKVFKTKVFGEPTVVFCGTAGNKFIATNEEKLFLGWRPHSTQKLFRSTYQTIASASTPRETEVQVFRAPGYLRPEALVRYLETMDPVMQEHMNVHWKGKEKVKVFELVQLLMVTLSCKLFLGFEDDNRIAKLTKYLDAMSIGQFSIPVNFPGTIFYRAKRAASAIRKEILVLINEKRIAMSKGRHMQDILSYMIANPDPTGRFLPDHEIADKVMGLLVAGFSTPTTATTFLMKYMGEMPEVYDKIRNEQMEIASTKISGEALNWDDLQKMKYSWNVALEVMRFIPPFQGTFREAKIDFTYEGYTIPKGWKIFWSIYTTNKNPDYFPEPEKFEPTRFGQTNVPPPYSNVPFGGGHRTCPGNEYARILMLSFLHNVVKKFKWEVIFPNEKISGNIIPMPVKGLPVRLHPHDLA